MKMVVKRTMNWMNFTPTNYLMSDIVAILPKKCNRAAALALHLLLDGKLVCPASKLETLAFYKSRGNSFQQKQKEKKKKKLHIEN